MPYVEQQDILNASRGGLDIILTYYPQAEASLQSSRKEFKIRENERTPSARIKQLADGNYVVTDFGDDSTPRNGIQICMKEEEITYREAIVKLAGRYSVGGINPEVNKPGFEKRPAAADEKEGETYFDIKEEMTEKELAELGPLVTKDVCTKYNVYSLNSFTYIKNREAQVTTSNENYPIFMVDHGDFKKIYQPKNPDKAYRFRYTGTRSKDFVNGLKQVRKAYEEMNSEYEQESTEKEKKKMNKLTEIILASGERDALNVAGLGYNVIWLNSETASVDMKLYSELNKMAEQVYNLPDIDNTGKKMAIKLGLQYLDIKTIWLPAKLREYRDHRGKPRKDFRDYVEIWPRIEDFKKLMRVAMPMRFWDESYTDGGIKYFFNNEQA
jgi:5S rRNA maturation endonuclease (ribonuclease M5)